jgi:hypothetical protein
MEKMDWDLIVKNVSTSVDRIATNILEAQRKVASNPNHWPPFGCPAYVLDNSFQWRKHFQKWKQRAKPGIYIGKSSFHGRSVSLVLDCDSAGSACPQFHVAFDLVFDTVKDITTKPRWLIKAGLVGQKEELQ